MVPNDQDPISPETLPTGGDHQQELHIHIKRVAQLRTSQSDDYVSPSAILPLPKAGTRKRGTSRRNGSTSALTDTPVQDQIASSDIARKSNTETTNRRKNLSHTVEADCSTSSSDTESSDSDRENEELLSGDFVVVKVAGKRRVVHYVARIDTVDCDEYEDVFLQKQTGRVDTVFVINDKDEAYFIKEDIVQKLPEPVTVGGSARRSNQLKFPCDLKSYNIN